MEPDTRAAAGGAGGRFGPWRRLVFVIQAVVMTGLPFVRIGGESALRFDIPSLHLYVFGHTLFIQEFFLLLIATLLAVFLLVFLTVLLGRVWCGWFCPQSALLELQRAVLAVLKKLRLPARLLDALFLPVNAAFAVLVSATLIAYFVPPDEILRLLRAGAEVPGGLTVRFFLVFDAVVIFVVAGIFGRRFCRSVCPYAKLQGVLFDRSTLVIAFDPRRRHECMGCDRCVEVCPTGIDIKDGLQIECVACAECVDACRTMTERRGIAPLVGYRFGEGRRLRPPVLLSGLAVAALAGFLVFLVGRSSPMELVVTRTPGPLYQIGRGGDVMNRYRISVQNKTADDDRFTLRVIPAPFRLAGPATLALGARERRVLQVTVIGAKGVGAGQSRLRFEMANEKGTVVRREAAFFGPDG